MDSTPSMYTAAQDTDMSMDTTSSNLSSPSTPGSSMSVQAYTSQFIKEGLKFKMRQRMGSGSSQSVATTGGSSEISPFPSPVDERPSPAAAAANSATAKMTSKRVRLSNLTP